MSDQIIFEVRKKSSFLDNTLKKVRLINAILVTAILVTKLYDALIEIEDKNQKGE